MVDTCKLHNTKFNVHFDAINLFATLFPFFLNITQIFESLLYTLANRFYLLLVHLQFSRCLLLINNFAFSLCGPFSVTCTFSTLFFLKSSLHPPFTIDKSSKKQTSVRLSRAMPEQSNDYRVVVFGAGGVGKSSLVLRFVKGIKAFS